MNSQEYMANLKNMKRKIIVLFFLLLLFSTSWAASPMLKVDLDMSGRNTSEVTEPDYTAWVVAGANTDSKTLEGVTITFTRIGSVGTKLRTNWYKAGIATTRLTNDGIMVEDGDGGGQIQMRLSGLAAGNHSLLVYINSWDKIDEKTVSDIEVYLGNTKVDVVAPTNRVVSNYDAATTYIKFTAQTGVDVVIDFKSIATGNEDIKNVFIAGFELNVPNTIAQAWSPTPSDKDEHVDADTRSLNLVWKAPKDGSVVSYDIYFGTNADSVSSASRTSSMFKGNQTQTSFAVNNLYSMNKYYWRVDAIDAANNVTAGNLWYFQPRQFAFRGAEGYGRYARGGRGGVVVEVTNLNDSGPGSLRHTIDNISGPITIVFTVAGVINLTSKQRISLSKSYVTIAGQTAPGKGICVSRAPFGISGGTDNIIRFMRVRLGKWNDNTSDGMGMSGANYSIIDHSSISWTIDEAFSSRNAKNITLQNTIISEALNVAGHKNYPAGTGHGYAATIGGDTASFLRNLLAHNEGRNWSLGGGLDGNGYYAGRLDILNNIVYNYGGRATDGGANEVNFVNNYYKQGRHSIKDVMLRAQHEAVGAGTQRYYAKGNVLEEYNNGNYGKFICTDNSPDSCGCTSEWEGSQNRYRTYLPVPFFPSYATIYKATDAIKIVLSDVGCNYVQDDHDRRVILDARNGTTKYRGGYTGKYGIPDNQSDVGGYEEYPEVHRPTNYDSDHDGLPDWWEVLHGTNPNSPAGDFSDTNADPDGDGYTYMDDYLDYLSIPNYETRVNRQISIDLRALALGFTKNPTYTVLEQVNGAVAIDGTWAYFLPDNDFAGIAYFTFKVKDSENTEWSRRVGVRVEP